MRRMLSCLYTNKSLGKSQLDHFSTIQILDKGAAQQVRSRYLTHTSSKTEGKANEVSRESVGMWPVEEVGTTI